MNTDKHRYQNQVLKFICIYLCLPAVPFLLLGCAVKPSSANIELRKRIQAMEAEVADMKRAREGDAATIRSLQQQQGTLATLPHDRLEKLYTVHGLSFERLTAADKQVLSVHVVPIDRTGDELKAAGSFVVEAFDLARQGDNVVGRWEFNNEQTRASWFGSALLYNYVLRCPWPKVPEHSQITVKVTFRDELTQREYTAQKIVEVN